MRYSLGMCANVPMLVILYLLGNVSLQRKNGLTAIRKDFVEKHVLYHRLTKLLCYYLVALGICMLDVRFHIEGSELGRCCASSYQMGALLDSFLPHEHTFRVLRVNKTGLEMKRLGVHVGKVQIKVESVLCGYTKAVSPIV